MARRKPTDEVEPFDGPELAEAEPVEEVAEEVAEEVVPDPAKHIHLEDCGFVEHADAAAKPRQLFYGGRNYEHVGEVEQGIWSYRAM